MAAIDPGRSFAASAIARPRSRTSPIVSRTFIAPAAARAANSPTEWPTTKSGIEPALAQSGEHREARRHERRLLELRLDHFLERRVEAEPRQIEARGLAPDVEHLHRLGRRLSDITPHAGLERALAGEAECDLPNLHAAISSVHSITPDPHVRPAPIPVISTMSPLLTRRSRTASASASGIEPDDVFP